MKKIWIIGISMILISVNISGSFITDKKLKNITSISFDKNILYVGGSGPYNYTKISDAINNASSGDTIFVYSGIYFENININKSVNLTGENKNNTIIDGNRIGDVIYISADETQISEFTIKNSGNYWLNDSGIQLNSNYSIIKENIITNNNYGILIKDILSHHNVIENNEIIANNNSGISFVFYPINNKESKQKYNDDKNNGLISRNNNYIIKNNISLNNIGISVSDPIMNNIFYHNNYFYNIQDAIDESNNQWDNGYPLGGNFWDKYTGNDTDGDGIGDTPYNISGGNNQDFFPLICPYEYYYILNISAPLEIEEATEFAITIKSIGGTVIPDVSVEFNNVTKLTDSNGIVFFTAPEVQNDSYLVIKANKNEYMSDEDSILVIDYEDDYYTHIMLGEIRNVTIDNNIISFEAVNMIDVAFFPFGLHLHNSGEQINIKDEYAGLVGLKYIFALCEAKIFE